MSGDRYETQKNITDCFVPNEIFDRALIHNVSVDPSDIFVILGLQWSDYFEPNIRSKSNRGLFRMKNITLVSDTYSNNDLKDTYPVSTGLNSFVHAEVKNKYVIECKKLREG